MGRFGALRTLVVAGLLAAASASHAGERVDVTAMDGVQLIAELDGTTGPGVVLVPDADHDRRAEAATADALVARGFRVLRVDLRGRGESSGSADVAVADRDVEGAFRYLLGRKIRPVFLIGQGATAPAVLAVAARVPTAGLVIVGPGARPDGVKLTVPLLRLDSPLTAATRTRLADWLSDPTRASTSPSSETR